MNSQERGVFCRITLRPLVREYARARGQSERLDPFEDAASYAAALERLAEVEGRLAVALDRLGSSYRYCGWVYRVEANGGFRREVGPRSTGGMSWKIR